MEEKCDERFIQFFFCGMTEFVKFVEAICQLIYLQYFKHRPFGGFNLRNQLTLMSLSWKITKFPLSPRHSNVLGLQIAWRTFFQTAINDQTDNSIKPNEVIQL